LLTELHEDHVDTLNDLRRVSADIHAARAAYQQEDDRALEQARQAYSEGKDAPTPKRTPQIKREEHLRTLEDRAQIVMESLRVLVAEIVQQVQLHEDEWSDQLRTTEAEAAQKVQELRRQLQAAEQEAEQAPDLRNWIQRTAKNLPGNHLHWGWFTSEKPTTDVLKITNEGRSLFNSRPSEALKEEMLQKQGGGLVDNGDEPTDPEDQTVDYTSESYINQLDDQLRDYVRNRQASETGSEASAAEPGGL
jgi:hypothetical protein